MDCGVIANTPSMMWMTYLSSQTAIVRMFYLLKIADISQIWEVSESMEFYF
jgi:hypothetical protein